MECICLCYKMFITFHLQISICVYVLYKYYIHIYFYGHLRNILTHICILLQRVH